MAFVDPQQQVFRTGQGMQPADHPDFLRSECKLVPCWTKGVERVKGGRAAVVWRAGAASQAPSLEAEGSASWT